jgi:mono/diheme cytochrome c family protein
MEGAMRAAILSLFLAGCAAQGATPPLYWGAGRQLTAPEERGRAFAYRRCGGCHNVGPDDGEPRDGPAFKKLVRLYTPMSLERRFAEVNDHGTDAMPPITFSRSEAEDLLAYVETLDPR